MIQSELPFRTPANPSRIWNYVNNDLFGLAAPGDVFPAVGITQERYILPISAGTGGAPGQCIGRKIDLKHVSMAFTLKFNDSASLFSDAREMNAQQTATMAAGDFAGGNGPVLPITWTMPALATTRLDYQGEIYPVRLMLIYDLNPSVLAAATALPNAVLEGDTWSGQDCGLIIPPREENAKRFIILMDELIFPGHVGNFVWKKEFDLSRYKLTTIFNAAGNTAYTACETGALWLMMVGITPWTLGYVEVGAGSCRVYYTD